MTERVKTIDNLQKQITEMEDLSKKSEIVEVHEKDIEDLDLSFGPRFCDKCDLKKGPRGRPYLILCALHCTLKCLVLKKCSKPF